MSTGKEIAARVAAECGGVKPWGDRAAEVPDGAIVTSLHISSFMQAEIDELRAENARLKAVPMKYKRMAFNAELQAENARLRDALRHVAATHAWLAFGECRAFGTDTLLTSAEADKLARAALGGKL